VNLIDSSGWLEYFTNGRNAHFFASAIEDVSKLIVSTINIYEVFKKVLRERDETMALHAIALMRQGGVCPVDEAIALRAAAISAEKGLPMVDSLILATAHIYGATLWTQDSHFQHIEGVKYIAPKKK